ncbi:MAG: metallopeptidase [bacterium]|nr:MAG: metallopeptidase [bacterium]
MKKFLTSLLLFCLLLSPINYAQAHNPADPEPNSGVNIITASALKDYLYFIASDEMEGRDTPSRGLDMTAKFIAMNLSRWGLKPGGDSGSFFQKMSITLSKTDVSNTSIEIGGETYKPGTDFLAFPNAADITASLVFASHGWVIKSKNINPYQNIDIKDKIVIISGEFPKGATPNKDLTGKSGEDWDDPYSYVDKHGGKGIIVVPDFMALADWERNIARYEEKGVLVFDKLNKRNISIPTVTLSPKLLGRLFSREGQYAGDIFNDSLSTQNVIGVLEGSDPILKDEYVAIGAHYDHVGVGSTPINGDKIFNGADDDGSGTVAVLQLAEAFSHAPRPKRSIMFVWHCGEEKGLLGSRYLMKFPTIPVDKIITQLNIDMIGRSKKADNNNSANNELSGPDEIYVIGSKLMSSELGQVSESVNNSSNLNLKFNYKYDDPNDSNRFFFRSDHFNYAQKGIPIIFYFNGVHEDYHRPSDSVEKIDYQKMEKVTRTIYLTAV